MIGFLHLNQNADSIIGPAVRNDNDENNAGDPRLFPMLNGHNCVWLEVAIGSFGSNKFFLFRRIIKRKTVCDVQVTNDEWGLSVVWERNTSTEGRDWNCPILSPSSSASGPQGAIESAQHDALPIRGFPLDSADIPRYYTAWKASTFIKGIYAGKTPCACSFCYCNDSRISWCIRIWS